MCFSYNEHETNHFKWNLLCLRHNSEKADNFTSLCFWNCFIFFLLLLFIFVCLRAKGWGVSHENLLLIWLPWKWNRHVCFYCRTQRVKTKTKLLISIHVNQIGILFPYSNLVLISFYLLSFQRKDRFFPLW